MAVQAHKRKIHHVSPHSDAMSSTISKNEATTSFLAPVRDTSISCKASTEMILESDSGATQTQ
jgi:hypothetical protein